MIWQFSLTVISMQIRLHIGQTSINVLQNPCHVEINQYRIWNWWKMSCPNWGRIGSSFTHHISLANFCSRIKLKLREDFKDSSFMRKNSKNKGMRWRISLARIWPESGHLARRIILLILSAHQCRLGHVSVPKSNTVIRDPPAWYNKSMIINCPFIIYGLVLFISTEHIIRTLRIIAAYTITEFFYFK